ncbi:MAG: hypothetical protein AAF211_02330, partial [Myxococcota bacterium]
WSLTDGARLHTLAPATSGTWSADGSVVVTAFEGAVTVWMGDPPAPRWTAPVERADLVIADGAPPPPPRLQVEVLDARYVLASDARTGSVWVWTLEGESVAYWWVPGARVSVSPRGDELFTYTRAGVVERWALPRGRSRGRVEHDLGSEIRVSWAPDGSTYALGTSHEVQVFTRAGVPRASFYRADGGLSIGTLTAAGHLLVQPLDHPTVVIDVETGARRWLSGSGGRLGPVGFGPDSRELAFVWDGALVRWDLTRGRLLTVADGMERAVWAGTDLVGLGLDGSLWGPGKPRGSGRVHDLRVSEDGSHFVAWGPEVARVYEVGRRRPRLVVAGERMVDARLSPAGDVFAIRDEAGARVWTESGAPIRLKRQRADRLWLPDARRAWLGTVRTLFEHELETGDVVKRLGDLRGIVVDRTAQTWVATSRVAVLFRDVQSLALRAYFMRDRNWSSIRDAAYPSDLSWLGTLHADALWLWDPADETVTHRVELPWLPHDVMASPDGRWCVVVNRGGELWWVVPESGEVALRWTALPGRGWRATDAHGNYDTSDPEGARPGDGRRVRGLLAEVLQ